MISIIAIISLHLIGASSALNIHSPVHITRPLKDVKTKCERDVAIFCTLLDQGSQWNDILPEKASKNEDGEDEKFHRRLTEELTSRRISLQIGITFKPKDGKESNQHAKDTQRFLNHGPSTDNCLWNAFNAQKLSDECTSALTYFNDSIDHIHAKYDIGSERSTTKLASISFSGSFVSFLILCYIAFKLMSSCEDDGENDDADRESIERLDKIAFVAVPLTVV